MKTLNVLAHPIIIFLVVLPLMLVSAFVPKLIVFVSFTCWALYFLLGANLKSGLWGALCFVLGELFAIAIILQFLATPGLGIWSLTLSVAFWAALIILLAERVKPIAAVPAYFQGAGLYFAAYFFWWPAQPFTVPGDYLTVTILVALSMAFGFLNGWVTVWLYGAWGKFYEKYQAKIAAPAPSAR
jgi:hypothetical protein